MDRRKHMRPTQPAERQQVLQKVSSRKTLYLDILKAYKEENAGDNGAHRRAQCQWRVFAEAEPSPSETNDGGTVLL